MAKKNGSDDNQSAQQDSETNATIQIIAQYVKDLSFENPNAPNSLAGRQEAPQININIGVNVKQITDTDFEVELATTAKAGNDGDNLMFQIEVVYAGFFRIANVSEENLRPLLFIECPRLLFPYARQITSLVTQQGGFPPLLIDPIDFVQLYRQRMEVEQQHEEDSKK